MKRTTHKDTDWAAVAGVNFFQQSEREFICIDYGGIYEDLLTLTRVDTLHKSASTSTQVHIFSHMARHDQAKEWLKAKDSSLEYHRHYFTTQDND